MALLLRAIRSRASTCTNGQVRCFAVSMADGQKQAFGYGDVAPKDAPGFDPVQAKPPETIRDTVKYISKGMGTIPLRKEIVEALGYPGQKHSAGTISTIGRIYYGPGRYDYGQPKMPKSWFANFFYPFWEIGHLLFVADRWIAMRIVRHILGISFCFFPLWLTAQWNIQAWEEFKAKYPQ
eukprot:TRINITY_DN221_c0_g1_i1.p1 TRINITY_DN221_c0_g1~~TRINITY_DN221_c0_g1_i1.p1  ORF type:complete len:202 (+),score=9.20 TRINITY_DN221_c0_g1_i1:67-606(+)